MLVLSTSELARDDDDVIIRDKVTGRILCEVTLIEIRGKKCRMGYSAPDDVEINRRIVDKAIHPTG